LSGKNQLLMILTMLGALAISQGCLREVKKKALPKPAILSASDDEIIEMLRSNQKGLKNIKIKARARIKVPDAETALDLDGSIAVEKPHHIRLMCHDLLEKRMDLLSDGKEFWLLVNAPGIKKVYKGSSLASAKKQIPFGAELLIEALGVGRINWPEESLHIIEKYPDAYIVFFLLPEKGKLRPLKRVRLDRRNLRISGFEVFSANGRLFARTSLSDYREVGGFDIPHSVRIEWPFEESFIELKSEEMKVNRPLPEKIWQFKVPGGFPVIEIGEEGYQKTSPVPNETEDLPRPPHSRRSPGQEP